MARPRKPRIDLGPAAAPVAHGELWEGIADSLRGMILAGAIPAGAPLVEGDLAARFGVSRGPVRDALRELAREGLVADLPRRGTVVSTLTFADLREVYEVREALEVAAAELAVTRAGADDLAALAAAADAMEAAWAAGVDYPESLALDLAFHRSLVGLAGNGRLAAAYAQMAAQTRLLAVGAADVNLRLRRALRPSAHRDISAALAARDAAAVRAAVVAHYA
ncbi:MAG: GntR family transcriptional regulator [Chloroflexota bacterium]